MEDVFFELGYGRNFINISPLRLLYPDSNDFENRNLILVKISISGGGFSGSSYVNMTTADFEGFNQQLRVLRHDLLGVARLSNDEEQIEIEVIGDGLGHLAVKGRVTETDGEDSSTFSLAIVTDQTSISGWINQLTAITKAFPTDSGI